MKKTILLSLTAAVFMLACHKKTVPEKTVLQTDQSSQTTQPTADATAGALVEQGKTVFSEKCNKCHALKNPADFTAQQWNGILKSMAPKAKLTDDQTKQVMAYVLANAKQ
ncbi:MAG TPA: hypothetical protein VFS36_01110 [Chitinophagaceae bacterium]|jgi:cytochrome c5|nr:hypothetical protein [Chitinophagaceae bacterium]